MKLILSLWFSLVSYHLVSLDDQRQDMDTIDHEHFSLQHVELEKLNVWNKRCYTLAGESCNPNPCEPSYNKSGFLDTWFPWIKKTRIIKDMRQLCNVVWIFHHRWWWNHNIIILYKKGMALGGWAATPERIIHVCLDCKPPRQIVMMNYWCT